MSLASALWTRVLPAGLTLLGLTQPIGFALGSQRLQNYGWRSGLSPLPMVFFEISGSEPLFLVSRFVLHTESGMSIDIDVNPATYRSAMAGPHQLVFAYGLPTTFAYLMPRETIESVVRYTWCRPGILRSNLGITEQLRRITVHVREKGKPDNKTWDYGYECEP